jgi:guanylate kinase
LQENNPVAISNPDLIEKETPARLNSPRPLLLVVSAPSGAGKSTLCNRLVDGFPKVSYSVSCTTRAPRGEEQDGIHYYFLSKKEFKERVRNGEFLEHAKVHGNFYGTLEDTVLYAMEEGNHVLLDIDVQGAAQIREALVRLDPRHPIRQGFTDIFILPPSCEELEKRVRGRGTDKDCVVRKRLATAIEEMDQAPKYSHQIINDDLDTAYAELKAVIRSALGTS